MKVRIPVLMLLIAMLTGMAAAGPAEPRAALERYSSQEGASAESQNLYAQGRRHIEGDRFEEAARSFSQVVERGDYRPDGALYWLAYSLSRQGREAEALEALERLLQQYPESQWRSDGRRLRGSVRGSVPAFGVGVGAGVGRSSSGGVGSGAASGVSASRSETISPAARSNLSEKDELRLAILDSLMQADPEKALPQVKKILSSDASSAVKRRALFVLAQSGEAEAGAVVADTARNAQDPELQQQALHYLGLFGGEEGMQVLEEIYASDPGKQAKRQILQSFMLAGRKERLLRAVREESDPDLRRVAIHQLGVLGAGEELAQMYGQESDKRLRSALLEALFVAGRYEDILRVARQEQDPDLRMAAIQRVGMMGDNSAVLLELYRSDDSKQVKEAVLQALMILQDDEALIELAKGEQDPELRRAMIRMLGIIGSQKASDFLIQLLEERQQ
ncbi:MAG TPA: HEAT repeat domain-containing protein [Acidobacteriota bacterium]|nr:HEAT repeat domain-containing protein [Acidobacteriota bacterium]